MKWIYAKDRNTDFVSANNAANAGPCYAPKQSPPRRNKAIPKPTSNQVKFNRNLPIPDDKPNS